MLPTSAKNYQHLTHIKLRVTESVKLSDKRILIFPQNNNRANGQTDIFFTGNVREQCNLDFNCSFYSAYDSKNLFNLSSYDALVTGIRHGIQLLIKTVNLQNFVTKRPVNQVWGYWVLESARNPGIFADLNQPVLENSFNWTIFASPQATINRPYFYIRPKRIASDYESLEKEVSLDKKAKSVCWIVSNCYADMAHRTVMGRKLIAALKNKAHLWGMAANSCLSSVRTNVINHGPVNRMSNDLHTPQQKIISDCKFYIAFENSICAEYITEKFVNALKVGAVPIVNGWRDSYEEVLPGGFIHTSDFKSMEHLAEHVNYLLENRTALMQYHNWRKTKQVDYIGLEANCQMCQKLSHLEKQRIAGGNVNTSFYTNLASSLKQMQPCV
ncbi:4-galactosyl-N-acetylglucosaminide 3-alpha-L-fucosyltransferase 9-like isoform X2 [Convolutriloba macropyga]|uniref:4-galactosyl-N-acetylglucosaminide 3-alpha-L-fucosyltransferase 9-like isoform X2 n=1 Tax=Convolutriloba macropyga TaxID=536237 RepID=UPI003F525E9A